MKSNILLIYIYNIKGNIGGNIGEGETLKGYAIRGMVYALLSTCPSSHSTPPLSTFGKNFFVLK